MSLMYDKTKQTPFNMIGNIFYVGTKFVSSHLFTSEKGHILIDACMPDDGPVILENIKALGFDVYDIRYLLITHAHIDHVGSAAYIAKETGASVCVGEADVPAAEHGQIMRYDKFGNKTGVDLSTEVMGNEKKYWLNFEPVEVDRTLNDGDYIKLGTTAIKVYHIPGHTVASCRFSFQVEYKRKKYSGLLPGGISVNVFQDEILKDNIFGANIYDYINGLKQMQTMDVDVWLGAHPFFNETFEKWERLQQHNENINQYIDPEGGKIFLNKWLKEAEDVLRKLEG